MRPYRRKQERKGHVMLRYVSRQDVNIELTDEQRST